MIPNKKRIYFWSILWAIFPPVLFFLMIYWVLKPAIKGKVPEGLNYVFWIWALMAWSCIFDLPFALIRSVSDTLKSGSLSNTILFINLFVSFTNVCLILVTLRIWEKPNSYLPLKKFKIDIYLCVLYLLAFIPLIDIFISNPVSNDAYNFYHPLIISFYSCLKNNSYIGLLIGFIGIGVMGPIFEEFTFRGLLLENTHDIKRRKWVRFLLDSIVCLFFALIHLPFSFIFPLALAAASIYVRRKTQSLIPSITLHCTWNINVLFAIIVDLKVA